MLGESMLVAPKITTPTDSLEALQMQEVTFTLPEGSTWYNYYSKKQETTVGAPVTRNLPDLEQAVFIKGGSVMPTLLHDDCMAISTCMFDKIRLDVYLDADQKASGNLYTDDGVSFKHETDKEYATVAFKFDGNLSSELTSTEATYTFPKSQTIDQVAIYGLSSTPTIILQNGYQVPDWTYSASKGGVFVAMPAGVAPDQVILELVYN